MWRFNKKEDSFRRRTISTKFCLEDGGWFTRMPSWPYGVGLWKKICMREEFIKCIKWKVGSGKRVRFWQDE